MLQQRSIDIELPIRHPSSAQPLLWGVIHIKREWKSLQGLVQLWADPRAVIAAVADEYSARIHGVGEVPITDLDDTPG